MSGLDRVTNLVTFDNTYTALLNGFEDANDYYARCSSELYLPSVRVTMLLLNARNGQSQTDSCFPDAGKAFGPNGGRKDCK